jgi:hypothetical protein
MAGNNINVGRALTGATNSDINYKNLALDQHRSSTAPTFQRAVVHEVIYNPKVLAESDRSRLRAMISNPTAVDMLAANSVIATLITDGMSTAMPTKVLIPPFFQSHFMLPIRAGEQVIVLFEDAQKNGILGGKWISRASEGLPVEDPNFTHSDRRFSSLYAPATNTSESAARSTGTAIPNFQNGGGRANTYSISQADASDPYGEIYRASISGSLPATYEVVPRWTKRPQELVLQGMNNSLIMLGQDRVGNAAKQPDDPRVLPGGTEQTMFAGAIDLVTGRGRYPLAITDTRIPDEQAQHKGTSAFVVTNSRGLEEVDKAPKINGKLEQLAEGDPDFIRDAARIYVSMKTLGDSNFHLARTTDGGVDDAMQTTGINYSPLSLYPVQFPSSSIRVGSSYVVNKADHLRLVARRSVPSEDQLGDPVISGSLLLIKEGKNRTPEEPLAQASDSDHLAYMYFSPEGRVQLDGMQIFLGGAACRVENQNPPPDVPSNINGSNSEIEVGGDNLFAGAEPYIKWSEFKKVVEGLQNQINDLHDAFASLSDKLNSTIGNSVCTPFGPDAAWAPLAADVSGIVSSLESSVESHRTETNQAVYRSRSAKIFGS